MWLGGEVVASLTDPQRSAIGDHLRQPAPAATSLAFAGLIRACPDCIARSLVAEDETLFPGMGYRCPKCGGLWLERSPDQTEPHQMAPVATPSAQATVSTDAQSYLLRQPEAGPAAATEAEVPEAELRVGLTEGPVKGPDDALQRLLEGNARFRRGQPLRPNTGMDRLPQVASGQSPFAVVVCCSDSRVPPEIVFDRGIGDLFIVRTAGHVLDSAALASVVYAVEELATPLVLVLGHTQCGAVHAALQDGNAPEYLRSVVRAIRPSLDASATLPGSRSDNVARVHVARTAERIRATLATEAVSLHASSARVVGAMYGTATGEVTLLPDDVVQLVQDASETAAGSETRSHTSREPIVAPDREEELGGSETEQTVLQPVHTGSPASATAPPITRWCPKCRTGYPEEVAFCTRCGVLLVQGTFGVACLRCRKPNQIGSDRCYACGADLHPPWLAGGGRRKPGPPVVLDRRPGGGNATGCGTSATLILCGAGALTLIALRVLGF